jgi:hypothetical protein
MDRDSSSNRAANPTASFQLHTKEMTDPHYAGTQDEWVDLYPLDIEFDVLLRRLNSIRAKWQSVKTVEYVTLRTLIDWQNWDPDAGLLRWVLFGYTTILLGYGANNWQVGPEWAREKKAYHLAK